MEISFFDTKKVTVITKKKDWTKMLVEHSQGLTEIDLWSPNKEPILWESIDETKTM